LVREFVKAPPAPVVASSAPVVRRAPVSAVKKQRKVVRVRNGRMAIRRTPQPVHPGDLVRSRRLHAAQAANATVYDNPRPVTYAGYVRSKAAAPIRTTDAVHGLTTVGPIIEADVTASGNAQMGLVWTNTVPRRLIQRKVRVRRVASTHAVAPTYAPRQTPVVRVSSKSRYVQVATFGVQSNAARTVQRFQSRGLPVTSRTTQRSGKAYKVVYLGPFNSSAQLRSAMSAAQRAGFRDAIYR